MPPKTTIMILYGMQHHDAVNRIETRLKTRCHDIPASRLIIEHTVQSDSACEVASKIAEAIVVKLIVRSVPNMVGMIVL